MTYLLLGIAWRLCLLAVVLLCAAVAIQDHGGADRPGASAAAAELAERVRERVDLVVETRCAERGDWSGLSDEEVEAATVEFVERMRALRRSVLGGEIRA